MPDTFREFLKRLMTAPADPADPTTPAEPANLSTDADAENLSREPALPDAGPDDANPDDASSETNSDRANLDESAPRASSPVADQPGQESRGALPDEAAVLDSPGTLAAEPAGSESSARVAPQGESAAFPRTGLAFESDPAADSFEPPGRLSAFDWQPEASWSAADPLPPGPIDDRAGGPLSIPVSPTQAAGFDRSTENIPPAGEPPPASLAMGENRSSTVDSSTALGGASAPSSHLETILDALDRQVRRAESGQSRVLERLDELLERTHAAHAEQSRLEGRIDQLEAAQLLRGRL
jgi:hypothetical protein